VARFSPSRLLLLERPEPALYTADRELREAWPALAIVPVVGDVCDRERMLAVFREHRPQVVAHAAAHKHVPLMETNAPEAVKNNVLGSQTLGEVAGECGAESFISYFMTIPEAAVLTLQARGDGAGRRDLRASSTGGTGRRRQPDRRRIPRPRRRGRRGLAMTGPCHPE